MRIHIVGSPGSGTSTSAGRLASTLGVPAHDLDHLPPPPEPVTRTDAQERDLTSWEHLSGRAADLAQATSSSRPGAHDQSVEEPGRLAEVEASQGRLAARVRGERR